MIIFPMEKRYFHAMPGEVFLYDVTLPAPRDIPGGFPQVFNWIIHSMIERYRQTSRNSVSCKRTHYRDIQKDIYHQTSLKHGDTYNPSELAITQSCVTTTCPRPSVSSARAQVDPGGMPSGNGIQHGHRTGEYNGHL